MIQTKELSEPEFNKKEALRYSGCKDANDDINKLLTECFDEAKDKLTYKVCYDFFDVKKEDDSITFGLINTDSDSIKRSIGDCKKVLVFAATVGTGIDRLIKKYERISPGKSLMMQGIGAERVESLCDVFCAYIASDLKKDNLILKPRISPGYGDMPLSMQKEVFMMLDCTKKTGITLNDKFFMTPTKSVTAFAGIRT